MDSCFRSNSDAPPLTGTGTNDLSKAKSTPAVQETRRKGSVLKDDCRNIEGMKNWMLMSILVQHLHLSN